MAAGVRRPGEISIVSMTSPKVAAQASKCSMPRLRSPSGSRNRCIVYISTIVLEIGVPVANVTPWPGCCSLEVAGLHVQVEGPFAAAGLDAGDAVHLGRRLQVLEIMGLVDEDVIDAEFVEHQPVILLVLGEQVLQPFLARGLLLLDGLDEVAVGTLGVGTGTVAEQLVVFGDLLARGTVSW